MTKPIVYFDCDGVLTDYTSAFLDFTGLTEQGVTLADVTDYDLGKLFPGGANEMFRWMQRFHNSQAFANLKPLVSPLHLDMLKIAGFELRVLTQISTGDNSRLLRLANLAALFGPVFDKVEFTTYKECKWDVLKRQNRPFIILEDSPKFLARADAEIGEEVKAHGWCQHQVYAILHPYNSAAIRKLHRIIKVRNTTIAIEQILLDHLATQNKENLH